MPDLNEKTTASDLFLKFKPFSISYLIKFKELVLKQLEL